MKRRVYIAGPITGYDLDERMRAFRAAADGLKAAGHFAVLPYGIVEYPWNDGLEWTDYLREDIRRLTTCDGIALLHNWQNSKGAIGERNVGMLLGLDIRPLESWIAEAAKAPAEVVGPGYVQARIDAAHAPDAEAAEAGSKLRAGWSELDERDKVAHEGRP